MLRFILVLLLAFGAMPAFAAPPCHDIAAMAKHHGGMPDRHQPATLQHSCIGCMPVGDWRGATVAPPLFLPAPSPVATIAALPLLPAQAPTPPPPRIA